MLLWSGGGGERWVRWIIIVLYEMGARATATATAAAAGKESIVIGKEGKKRGAEEQSRRGLPGSDQTKGRFW